MNKFFKQLSAIFVASIISTAALAQNPYPVQNAIVLDHYKGVVKQMPYEVEVCKRVRQGTGDGSATNEIIGAIIGGAIGNKLGENSEDAKDVMTLAGIILGASMANDAQKVNSTGQVVVSQEVCETKVKTSYVKKLSHYLVHIDYEGRDLSFTSKKRPYDDVIKIKVTVSSLD